MFAQEVHGTQGTIEIARKRGSSKPFFFNEGTNMAGGSLIIVDKNWERQFDFKIHEVTKKGRNHRVWYLGPTGTVVLSNAHLLHDQRIRLIHDQASKLADFYGHGASQILGGDLNVPHREDCEADLKKMQQVDRINIALEEALSHHRFVEYEGGTRANISSGIIQGFTRLARFACKLPLVQEADLEIKATVPDLASIARRELGDHLPLHLRIQPRSEPDFACKKLPIWLARDSRFRAIFKETLASQLEAQDSKDAFTSLAVYKDSLRVSWKRFAEEKLSDEEWNLESDEAYQKSLVLAWRCLRSERDTSWERVSGRSPRLRALEQRVRKDLSEVSARPCLPAKFRNLIHGLCRCGEALSAYFDLTSGMSCDLCLAPAVSLCGSMDPVAYGTLKKIRSDLHLIDHDSVRFSTRKDCAG